MDEKELFKRLHLFTEKSLSWCAREAEQGTTRVSQAVEQLMQNTARVSQVSADSLKALDNLQSFLSKDIKGKSINQLKESLTLLSRQNQEADNFIQPIIESLQFQDRLRQNLENISKMLAIWFEKRQGLKADEAGLRNLGELLMKQTTMKRERDIIRDLIPGLDPEVETQSVTLF